MKLHDTDAIVSNNEDEWNQSYKNLDNFLFYPHEEVIRFVSKHIRKRVGLNKTIDVVPSAAKSRILDLGCGIGRHVMYCHDMELEAWGIDLSDSAIQVAREWAGLKGMSDPEQQLQQGDVRQLPWSDGFFHYAISHGVLDSMPYEIAKVACGELGRVMSTGGLFYCDLISGDDSSHAREFSGEEIITTAHEQGTVQLYFNLEKIHSMIDGVFVIEECVLIRREDVLRGGYTSRYHLVLKKV